MPATSEEQAVVAPPGDQTAMSSLPFEDTAAGRQGDSVVKGAKDDTSKQPTAVAYATEDPPLPSEVKILRQQPVEANETTVERGSQVAREKLEKRAAGANCMIFLVVVWLVCTGVLLIFAFSPVNVDLGITSMLLGVFIGIIGILSVSAKSKTGVQLYLVLGTVLLLLTVALWGYYIYILFRAARAAADIAADRASHWVSDTPPELLPDRYGSGAAELTSIEAVARQGGLLPDVPLDETVEPCRKGFEEYGANYFKSATSVFLGLSTRGQMCNYSHYDILDFKKWPVSCWRTCGFDHLAVDRVLDNTRLDDQKVMADFLAHLESLSPQETSACVLYSVRTACVAENTAYHYILLAVIAFLIFWTCCACMCCIPASLCVAGKYLSELKSYQKDKEAVERHTPPGADQIELAGA
ncbi:putative transmembrane protein [Toxoplasma gondii VAND]|uniref:Putative transmembrane protein n=1 Tax=Toxoplasma gondii VAND TaxID=933077 RepID=A0A086PS87_TOXGO|nr:putative transmembrane protein [Toxoplasma gondii VAND]